MTSDPGPRGDAEIREIEDANWAVAERLHELEDAQTALEAKIIKRRNPANGRSPL